MIRKNVLARAIDLIVYVLGAFGGFLLRIAPPDELGLAFPIGLGSFICLILLLCIIYLAKRYGQKKYKKWWFRVSVSCLLIAIILSIGYYKNYNRYTFDFPPGNNTQRYMGGTEMLPAANHYKDSLSIKSIPELVDEYGGIGSRNEIWGAESIECAGFYLLINYILLMIFFMLSLFILTEILVAQSKPE